MPRLLVVLLVKLAEQILLRLRLARSHCRPEWILVADRLVESVFVLQALFISALKEGRRVILVLLLLVFWAVVSGLEVVFYGRTEGTLLLFDHGLFLGHRIHLVERLLVQNGSVFHRRLPYLLRYLSELL